VQKPLMEAVDSLLSVKDGRGVKYAGGGTEFGDPTSLLVRLADPLQEATKVRSRFCPAAS